MRIAIVIERFLPSGGGVEQAAWNVVRGLLAAGDTVHVIARVAAQPRGLLPADRLHIHRIHVPTTWQPRRVVLFSRRADDIVRTLGPKLDVVHGFTRVRRQSVHRAGGGSHADFMLRTYGSRGARWRALSPRHRVLLNAERALYADDRLIVQCVSEGVRDELVARFALEPARLRVIHNGVDCLRFHPTAHRRAARTLRESLTKGAGPIWLLAGSGARRKGLGTALEALAACRDAGAELWVAGRDDPAPWRRRASELGLDARVRFLGARSDMPIVYTAADGLLLPTRYDAFSNACLEAAASGLPVVSSRANGAMELLAPAGRVVEDAEDVAGFAEALEALRDPSTRRSLGESARKIAEQNDWGTHVARLRAMYRSVLDERQSADATTGARP